MIIGQTGAGKSTLAFKLAEIAKLPVFHTDQFFWMPGWIQRPTEECEKLCNEAIAKEHWIIEGSFSQNWPARLNRAEMLICLDLPYPLRLVRILRRSWRDYGYTRLDMPDNCPERFSPEFYKWTWTSRRERAEELRRFSDSAPSSKTKYHLRSSNAVRSFLTEFKEKYGRT